MLYTLTQLSVSDNKVNFIASISNLTLQQVYTEIENTTDEKLTSKQKQHLLKNAGISANNMLSAVENVTVFADYLTCAIFAQTV